MSKETYLYELLVIDQSGTSEITTVKSMVMGLSYSEKLWKKPQVKTTTIDDKGLGISLHVYKAGDVEDDTEAAFILKAKSTSLEKADEFRENLLHHIKDKLAFTNIRVLKDSVSEHIARNIHMTVIEAESALRSGLSQLFLKEHGLNWWETVASKKLKADVDNRKDSKSTLGAFIDNDMMFTSFDDLLELSKKASIDSVLQTKLDALAQVKHKISFNNVFAASDLTAVEKLTKSILTLIEKLDAPTKKAAAKPAAKAAPKKVTKKPEAKTAAPKETPQPVAQKPVSKPRPAVKPVAEKKPEPAPTPTPVMEAKPESQVATVAEAPKPEPKKVEAPSYNDDAFMMITENKLLEELEALEAVQSGEISIKSFVKEVLARKGYMSGPAYGLAESMKDKGLVNIYETKDDKGFTVKVIKSN